MAQPVQRLTVRTGRHLNHGSCSDRERLFSVHSVHAISYVHTVFQASLYTLKRPEHEADHPSLTPMLKIGKTVLLYH
jgi:hypothetical protein